MGKFARIIELENDEQVLLTVDYEHGSDEYELVIRTDFGYCFTQMAMGFKEKEQAEKMLLDYTPEKAAKYRSDMSRMLENPNEG